jgi:hypothetical protein
LLLEIPPAEILDWAAELPKVNFDLTSDSDIALRFQEEFVELAQIPRESRNQTHWDAHPLTLSLGFLLCSFSRPALRLAQNFLRLSSESTIYRHFHGSLDELQRNLQSEPNIEAQIDLFMRLSGIEPHGVISVAVDAMALSSERPCLSAKASNYLFVFYVQSLSRPNKCLALHVLQGMLGRAAESVQGSLNHICEMLSERGLRVKYVCSDGDQGYNKRHKVFFKKWHPELLSGG